MAVYVSLNAKDYDCESCKWRHCTADNPAPFPLWTYNDEQLVICPKGSITRESSELIRWYNHYLNNHLPVKGGLLDQSAVFVEAVEIITRTISRYERNR